MNLKVGDKVIVIAGSNKGKEGTIKKVGQEMILWKLLSNKKFTGGDISEEQRRIIIDVPKQLN